MLPAYMFIFVVIIIILGMAIKILNEYERALSSALDASWANPRDRDSSFSYPSSTRWSR